MHGDIYHVETRDFDIGDLVICIYFFGYDYYYHDEAAFYGIIIGQRDLGSWFGESGLAYEVWCTDEVTRVFYQEEMALLERYVK